MRSSLAVLLILGACGDEAASPDAAPPTGAEPEAIRGETDQLSPAGMPSVGPSVAKGTAAGTSSAPSMPETSGPPPAPTKLQMIPIPAGTFTMGTDPTKEPPPPAAFGLKKIPYEAEGPPHEVELPLYYIDRTEVTHWQFARYLKATGKPTPEGLADLELEKWPNYPVSSVSWQEAFDFCAWRGTRLPTEAEWEKAAKGPDHLRYPWGAEYDEKKTNNTNQGTTPVGYFKADISQYGLVDLGGNVFEWVQDWYQPYPGNEEPDPDYGETHRVLRGGSWGGPGHYNVPYYARTTHRQPMEPDKLYEDIGFRCARDAPAGGAQ